MHKAKHNLLILLSLVGLGISLYLTVHHFKILAHGFQGPSFCSFGDKFDCDVVNMSSYAKLGPFPVAGLGLVYFLYLSLAAIYARIASDSAKSALALPWFASIPSLLFSIYLGSVSSFVLGTWCILCISLYAINFLVFWLLSSLLEIKILHAGSFMIQYFKKVLGKASSLGFNPKFAGNFLFALVLAGISLFILYANENKYAADFEDFDHKAYLDFFYAQPQLPPIDVKGRPLYGTEGAPVTIVEFSDFECPFCQKAAFNLKPRLKEFQKDIAFYYFAYPLDKSCNPYMQRELHEHACDATKAAFCAQEQGKFWPMHDKLFENQPKFNANQLRGYAKALGLDSKKFEDCITSDAIGKRILSDIEAGKAANLQGTPMVLVNGRVLKDWYNPVVLKIVIEEELKRAKKK